MATTQPLEKPILLLLRTHPHVTGGLSLSLVRHQIPTTTPPVHVGFSHKEKNQPKIQSSPQGVYNLREQRRCKHEDIFAKKVTHERYTSITIAINTSFSVSGKVRSQAPDVAGKGINYTG